MLNDVEEEIYKQLEALPRKEIAQKAIDNSKLILMDSEEEALKLINEYGPEHFIICSKNEDFFVNGIENAGSFLSETLHLKVLVIMLQEPIIRYQLMVIQKVIVV